MPSNTSNAVGTQRQFSPQPVQVYQQRLIGIPMNWRVDSARMSKSQDMSKAFEDLSRAMKNEDISEETREKEFADMVAPTYYRSLTNEQRKKMSTAQMLANADPRWRAQDNPFFTAQLDRLRGGEASKTAYAQIKSELNNLPPFATLKDQQDYVEQRMGELEEEWKPNEHVMNRVAYMDGFNENKLLNMYQLNTEYLDNKDLSLKAEATAKLANGTREMLAGVTPKTSDEEMKTKLDSLTGMMFNLRTGDRGANYQAMRGVAEQVAQTAGSRGLKMLADVMLPEGVSFGTVVPMHDLWQVGLGRDKLTSEEQITHLSQQLQACHNEEDINTLVESTSDGELREWLLSNKEQRLRQIERERQENARALRKQTEQQLLDTVRERALPMIINAVTSGEPFMNNGKKVPLTDKELETYGVTKADVFNGVMQGINSGTLSMDGYRRLLQHSQFSGYFRETVQRELAADLQTGNLGRTGLGHALQMRKLDDNICRLIFTGEQADSIEAIYQLIGLSDGDEQTALTRFKQAQQIEAENSKDTQDKKARLTDKLSNINGVSIALSTGDSLDLSLPVNVGVRNSIGTIAKYLMLSDTTNDGNEVNRAYQMAQEAIKSQYLSMYGSAVPKAIIHQVAMGEPISDGETSEEQRRLYLLMDVLRDEYHIDVASAQVSFVSDGYVSCYDMNGVLRNISTHDLIENATNRAKNYKGKHVEYQEFLKKHREDAYNSSVQKLEDRRKAESDWNKQAGDKTVYGTLQQAAEEQRKKNAEKYGAGQPNRVVEVAQSIVNWVNGLFS